MPESVAGMDTNGDMVSYDQDQSLGADTSTDKGGEENASDV